MARYFLGSLPGIAGGLRDICIAASLTAMPEFEFRTHYLFGRLSNRLCNVFNFLMTIVPRCASADIAAPAN